MDEHLEKVNSSLEIEEHLNAHALGFKIQRIGIIAIILFVAAAAVGVFGDGYFSKSTIEAQGATIHYERFYRFEGPMQLTVDVKSEGNPHVVTFESDYLANFKLEAVTPPQTETRVRDGVIDFVFEGDGPTSIAFQLIPKKFARTEGVISVNGSGAHISQFIFP